MTEPTTAGETGLPEVVEGHLYDYPKYYDLVYGSDWKAEFDFLEDVFEKHTDRVVERLFEPACGTGRLMIKFAKVGYDVGGNDLNPHAVEFCNDRLERHGFPRSAVVADMADFTLEKPVDACFNMINSFRHLPTEKAAESHLRCVANALAPGGLYVLGLHLTPTKGNRITDEAWPARRGNLAVVSTMWSEWIDLKKRQEHVGMRFDVYTPTTHLRIVDDMTYRTYQAKQMQKLLGRVDELELVETYDFSYDVTDPIEIVADTEDTVFVLRKIGK